MLTVLLFTVLNQNNNSVSSVESGEVYLLWWSDLTDRVVPRLCRLKWQTVRTRITANLVFVTIFWCEAMCEPTLSPIYTSTSIPFRNLLLPYGENRVTIGISHIN